MIPYGEAKQREEAAQRRRERFKVPPEVRAVRQAMLDRQEAAMQAEREARTAAWTVPQTAFKAVLERASDDELMELARGIGSIAPSKLADIVGEVQTARTRARIATSSRKRT